jgi:hypothetical protein
VDLRDAADLVVAVVDVRSRRLVADRDGHVERVALEVVGVARELVGGASGRSVLPSFEK